MIVCPNCQYHIKTTLKEKILELAKKEPVNFTKIKNEFGYSEPTVAEALRDLKNAGLLQSEKIGKKVFHTYIGDSKN